MLFYKPQIPETSHNAQRTSIRQSCSTMLDIESHLPVFVVHCYYVGRTLRQILTSLPVLSNAVPAKQGTKTMVANARWTEAGIPANLPVSITTLTQSIFFTHCHLSLSMCGHRKYAVLQHWHFVAVSSSDVKVANSREKLNIVHKGAV